jgi:hypothetical protein
MSWKEKFPIYLNTLGIRKILGWHPLGTISSRDKIVGPGEAKFYLVSLERGGGCRGHRNIQNRLIFTPFLSNKHPCCSTVL